MKHDWLNLIEVSGPFLAVPVLDDVFPQGLEGLDTPRAQRLRRAHDEWREAVDADDTALDHLHGAWIDEVLLTALEMDGSALRRGGAVSDRLRVALPEHGVTLAPDLAIVDPSHDDTPLLLVHVLDPDTDVGATRRFEGLATTPAERMVTLLRGAGCPLGLVTNGEHWMLVHAPVGSVASYAIWHARLWGQEPETLRAFVSLLGVRRFFGPEGERLPALYERSLKHQDDVTDALGEQVRRAVEVLVQAVDRADQDRNRALLRDTEPRVLYEAALTVMMRLVFLLAAEERGLLLLNDERYDAHYALSTLRMQLRAESDEILERRRSAWSRLLALFRAVYGGIEHPALRLPALGGSLFDPDRYPFLEGRTKGTNWRTQPAEPLPIDDRTVLLLLEAIQTFEGRTLSYRALDVEQIGHVYEGLLERTVKRVEDVSLELEASAKAKDPRVTLGELESAALEGRERVAALLTERSQRSAPAIRNSLDRDPDERLGARLLTVCRGDVGLRDRILPFVRVVRTDPWDYPLVHHAGAFVVVLGADRRETGTHYTPKSLTERIVDETLTPLVYRGPAEGMPRDAWVLRRPDELLDLKICDPAMGSGAFLVQACRFLSERLVEAWAGAEADGGAVDVEGRLVNAPVAVCEPLPTDVEARAVIARCLVVERCLYGVDMNPLAVELTKLSLWLTTVAKGRPFGFLDHRLKSGDSLLGIHDLRQLTELRMRPQGVRQLRLFGQSIERAVEHAVELRQLIATMPVRDICDVEDLARLEAEARHKLKVASVLADAFVGTVFVGGPERDIESRLTSLASDADRLVQTEPGGLAELERRTAADLSKDASDGKARRPFHWPLAFPEVFQRENGGFDAFVGNPPFLGNRLWKGAHGEGLQRTVQMVIGAAPGKIDLCVAFHRRIVDLLRSGGSYGLLAASNMAEGSAIEIGLGRIVTQGDLYFTRKGLPWPGKAAVVVAVVCFHKGSWNGPKSADGIACERIGPRLECEAVDTWTPMALHESLFGFAGVDNSKGLSFVVTPEDAWFERLKSEPNSLLRPYVTGDDITSYALQRIERWALDIADLGLEDIRSGWPVAYQFLVEVVQPTRTPHALKSYRGLHDRWWQFWNNRADLMRRLRKNEQFIAYSKVTKHPICMLAPSRWIYTNKVVLIALDSTFLHSICLSTFFRSWVEQYSGGNLGETLTLSISESIATFPRPNGQLSRVGVQAALRFDQVAVAWSADHACGLTEVMNAIHSPTVGDPRILELRSLLHTIDLEVALAYGWSDMELESDFRELVRTSSSDRARFTISEQDRAEVLRRLADLNRQQYEAEVVQGLHGKATRSGSSRVHRSRTSANQTEAANARRAGLGLGTSSDGA